MAGGPTGRTPWGERTGVAYWRGVFEDVEDDPTAGAGLARPLPTIVRYDGQLWLNTDENDPTAWVALPGGGEIDGSSGPFTTGTLSPAAIDIGDASSAGTGGTLARADHQHAFPAPAGAPPAIAAAGAAGSASTPARSDHTHAGVTSIDGSGGALSTGALTPAAIDIGDSASAGTSASLARADHQHALAAPAGAPPAIAAVGSAGSASTPARSDHTHAGVTSINGSGGAIVVFADRLAEGDNAEVVDSSDWAVNGLASAGPDASNPAEVVRLFDDTSEEGIGFGFYVPEGATNLVLTVIGWPQTAPGAVRTLGLKLYARRLQHNTAIAAWASVTVGDFTIQANRRPQEITFTIPLASFSVALVAGSFYHCELTRVNPAAGTELSGDFCFRALRLRAS